MPGDDGTSTGGNVSASGGTEPGAAGGAASGGTTSSAGGAVGGSGGELACCLADAICAEGDNQIAGESDCPVGASCYSNHVCCNTVWCAKPPEVQCDALPVCPDGTHETKSCPADTKCETVTVCGTTISCSPDSITCDAIPICPEGSRQVDGCPGTGDCSRKALCGTEIFCLSEGPVSLCDAVQVDYNRNYVGGTAAACAASKFTCDVGTTPFEDKCGCGCEQPATCPEFVDCMPGSMGTLDALCTSDECPYTLRAY